MADSDERNLTGDQMMMLENMNRGGRTVGKIKQLEDPIQASFDNISLGNIPGFRLAFDGRNSEIVKKSGRVRSNII
jgi:hypothetical protein